MTNTITATTNNNAAIKIWIGNLAAYNAGTLRGEWVKLPVSGFSTAYGGLETRPPVFSVSPQAACDLLLCRWFATIIRYLFF